MEPGLTDSGGGAATGDGATATAFHDLDRFLALPRVSGLHLSPDGSRLVASVALLDPARTSYVTSLWEVDPQGERPARRLTRSAEGESFAAFTPDGSLLFTSRRADPDAEPGAATDDAPAALWALPPSGEARPVAALPGGFTTVRAARAFPLVVALTDAMPGTDAAGDGDAFAGSDAERRKNRRDAKVDALLHDSYPVRYWDSDLGPGWPRLVTGTVPDEDSGGRMTVRPLTGHLGHALREASIDVTPDGATVVSQWARSEPGGSWRGTLVAFDVAGGDRRVLADDPDLEFRLPRISPDGTSVACLVSTRPTADDPGDTRLGIVPLDGGDVRVLTGAWDRWPTDVCWTADGAAVLVTADDDGRCPLFRVEADDGRVTRLTADAAAYSNVHAAPDGRHVYALRSALDSPPAPVRLDPATPDQMPTALPGPAAPPALPGRLDELRTAVAGGREVRSWVCRPDRLPDGETAAPLAVWVHGGPLHSWNDWSWRWCPWLLVAAGYTVVIPDFALSTGYGHDSIALGWGTWGGPPFEDVMAATEAAAALAGVDGDRAVVMGGSFGGYMTNWILGRTDRFRAAVSHAGLYALDQFGPTTDVSYYWRRQLTAEMEAANSPHTSIDAWRTPTLVVHGDRDYRVPVGEALRLWWDLAARHQGDDGVMPHRFLYFPHENHWVLSPQHAKLWYQTVVAFLEHHVRDVPWQPPELLR